MIGAAVVSQSCEFKSSQVKSSQVQISMAAAPAAFGAPAGARDREGAARRNRHGSPEPGLYPHFLFVFILIIAAPHYTDFVPFSGRLYVNAKPIQADDGSDRGHVQGLSSGGLRCWYGLGRAARLRRVWPSWARQGPVNRLGGGRQRRLARRRQEPSRVFRSARHTPPTHISLMRACTYVSQVQRQERRLAACSMQRAEGWQRFNRRHREARASRRSSSATGASEGAALSGACSGGIRRWALIYDWRWTRRA